MTSPNDNVINDERALEAFLAAAFRLDFPEEITDEEAKELFQRPANLSREDKEAISSWGTDFIERLVKEGRTASYEHEEGVEVNEELEQEYFAMNRDKDGGGLDKETRKKIDEERKKALEEEENEGNDGS